MRYVVRIEAHESYASGVRCSLVKIVNVDGERAKSEEEATCLAVNAFFRSLKPSDRVYMEILSSVTIDNTDVLIKGE